MAAFYITLTCYATRYKLCNRVTRDERGMPAAGQVCELKELSGVDEGEVLLGYLLRGFVWLIGVIMGAIVISVALIVIIVYPLVWLALWCCLKNLD